MKNLFYPPPLTQGDKVALTAPSSPVSPEVLDISIKSIQYLGLNPIVMPSCKMNCNYLSGPDIQRAKDINNAFSSKEIKGIFCLRGGYGTMRILPMLDFEMIKKNPKFLIGYSDITALHIALNQLCDLITFHGPMPSIDYLTLDDFTLNSLKNHIFYPEKIQNIENPKNEKIQSLYPGKISGILTGGNLALLTATLGSKYEIDTKGKILFIEDVGEEAYRLDRSLTTLSLAGKFKDCSGIIFGTFAKCSGSITEIIQNIISKYKKPAILNLRAGHIYPQITLPLGSKILFNIPENAIPNISVL